MKNYFFITFLACLLILKSVAPVKAALVPAFSLEYEVDEATLIAEGVINAQGKVAVIQVFKGHLQGTKLSLSSGYKECFASLSKVMKAEGPLQAILFLSQNDKGSWYLKSSTSMVGLSADGVYPFIPFLSSESANGLEVGFVDTGYSKHDSFTHAIFRAALQDALAVARERDRLLALPPSSGRTRAQLRFLQQKSEYHWNRVAQALRSSKLDEESVVLEALRAAAKRNDTQGQATQARLLDLLGSIRPTVKAFVEVEPFTSPSAPAEIRTSAIWTLRSISVYHATATFASMLSVDDPDLEVLLSALGPDEFSGQTYLFNTAAIGPLLRLSCALREPHNMDQTTLNGNIKPLLLQTLRRFGHPLLINELRLWSQSGDQFMRELALRELNNLTDSKFSSDNLDAWWKKAAPLLLEEYSLQSKEGLKTWLHNYYRADAATRRILVRLWFFERTLNESALLQTAAVGDKHSQGAKAALSELWQHKRLSTPTRHAIVSRFLTLRLVHLPNRSRREALEFQIIGQRDFSFPADSWVDYASCVAVGNEKLELDNMYGSMSLEGSGPIIIGSRGGGVLEGQPVARALLELREVDSSSSPNKVKWAHRWRFKPLPFLVQSQSKQESVQKAN